MNSNRMLFFLSKVVSNMNYSKLGIAEKKIEMLDYAFEMVKVILILLKNNYPGE